MCAAGRDLLQHGLAQGFGAAKLKMADGAR